MSIPKYYKYIYISREYYNDKVLDPNRIGIGQTNDPQRRLQEHNTKSSKSSTEIKFECIYIIPNNISDSHIHRELINLGYKNVPNKKEIFEGSTNKPLTIETVQKIVEKYSHSQPQKIYNNNLIHTSTYKQDDKTIYNKILKSFINPYNNYDEPYYSAELETYLFPNRSDTLILLLNNDKIKYNEIHPDYKNRTIILEWAYRNSKIKYHQLNPESKIDPYYKLIALRRKHITLKEAIETNYHNIKIPDITNSFKIIIWTILATLFSSALFYKIFNLLYQIQHHK